jgi:hypothetical protein
MDSHASVEKDDHRMMRKFVLSAVLALAPAVAFAAGATPGTDAKPAPAVKAETTVKTDAVKTDGKTDVKTDAKASGAVKTDGKTDAVKTDAGKSSAVNTDVKPVAASGHDTKGEVVHKAVQKKGKTSGMKAKAAPSEVKTDSKL